MGCIIDIEKQQLRKKNYNTLLVICKKCIFSIGSILSPQFEKGEIYGYQVTNRFYKIK